ncbi:unnamed protein product [Linum trigynum]|uniref:GBF-interacting protein 1 N-terminal domain-containing protein n=1 Tax=Linum trigynum TaxID=586398 RepID=A0AAV2EW50_9ROSI
MGSESGSISCGGGAEVRQVPPVHTKIVQSLKEVVNNGNYTDSDIYDVLRDCDMDPNAAVQKLLSQDIFREVKSKRERRKEMKDTQDLKSRDNSSHLEARVNAHRSIGEVQSQASYNELGKASYRRDNGSASPVLPSSSLTYEVKTPVDRPSPHSDSFEDKSASKNIRLVDSSAQSPLASQSDWPGGSSGHVSKADIVRVRGPQTKGRRAHLASISSSPEILQSAEGLQQLSLEEKPAEVTSENKHGVVFPNYMQAFAADCSHLSFGTYKSRVQPSMSVPAMSDSVRSNSFAATDSPPSVNLGFPGDSLSPDHLESMRNVSQLADGATNRSFPSHLHPELIQGSIPGASQQDEYFSQLSMHDSSSKKFLDHSTSSSIMMHPNALSAPTLHQELCMNSKTLPIEFLAANVESARNFDDLLSAFGSTHQIPTSHYGSIPPSTGSSSILIPEILNSTAYGLPTSYSQEFPGSNLLREPALLQHVTSQPFSQPALSSEEVAKLTGYPALSPNYVHSSSFSLQQHAYEETSFLNLARTKNLNQFKGDGSRSNFPQPDAADVSGYAGFGRQSNYRGKFPRDLSSNLSASAVGYGDTLRTSFTGGNNLSSLQQNDISSPWEYGPDKATLSAIPDNQYHSLHGYSQFLPRYNKQEQQQHSHDYGALGYGSSYPSQGRTVQEQWIGAGSVNSFPDPSSKQQKIWGQNY